MQFHASIEYRLGEIKPTHVASTLRLSAFPPLYLSLLKRISFFLYFVQCLYSFSLRQCAIVHCTSVYMILPVGKKISRAQFYESFFQEASPSHRVTKAESSVPLSPRVDEVPDILEPQPMAHGCAWEGAPSTAGGVPWFP